MKIKTKQKKNIKIRVNNNIDMFPILSFELIVRKQRLEMNPLLTYIIGHLIFVLTRKKNFKLLL